MKKTLIKTISLILAAITVFSVSSLFSFAEEPESITANSIANTSINEFIGQFRYSKAPGGLDYSYWSPEAEPGAKYPLVIYVHGLGHGWTKTSYVKDSYMPYWASSEMQSKFSAGGAHILLIRMPEYLVSATLTAQVKAAIDCFIRNTPSVDKDRILLMGGSAGGGAAWRLLINNPGFFSAAVILCATKTASKTDVSKVSSTPLWIVSAKTDPLINYAANQKVTWNHIKSATEVPDKCRWTTFNNKVFFPDGKKAGITHFLAKTLGFGLLDFDGKPLYNTTTVTADGTALDITDDGIVEWFMQSTGSADTPVDEPAEEPAAEQADIITPAVDEAAQAAITPDTAA